MTAPYMHNGEFDTLDEVMRLIQLKMRLDETMRYAADLWLPDGTRIETFEEMTSAAVASTPIIVGCGEPFDAARVPVDLRESFFEGGGRKGLQRVYMSLAESRQEENVARAENVRQDGHGVLPNSLAVVTARMQSVEEAREKAAEIRYQYMESLVQRQAENEDLRLAVRQNITRQRMEREESRMRKAEKERERTQALRELRARDETDFNRSRREDAEKAQQMHDRVKTGHAQGRHKKKAHTERYRFEARH